MAAVIPAEAAATAGQEVCLKTPTSLLIAPTNLNRKHKESHRKSLSSSLPRRPFDSTTLHPPPSPSPSILLRSLLYVYLLFMFLFDPIISIPFLPPFLLLLLLSRIPRNSFLSFFFSTRNQYLREILVPCIAYIYISLFIYICRALFIYSIAPNMT